MRNAQLETCNDMPHPSLLKLIQMGRWPLSKPVMFFDVFADFPGAGHAGGEGDQIPFADLDRFLPFGCDDNITFQKITGLGLIIGPWKFRRFFGPDGPVADTQLLQLLWAGISNHFDLAHATSFSSGSDGCKHPAVFRLYDTALKEIVYNGVIDGSVFSVKIQINGFLIPAGFHQVIKK